MLKKRQRAISIDIPIDILTDDQLNTHIRAFAPTAQVASLVPTSLVLFVSGHGHEGVTECRQKIISNIMKTYYKGDCNNPTSINNFRTPIIKYMTENVNVAMALGLPASLAPMMDARETVQYVLNNKPDIPNYKYRWDGLSSSAIDIEIVRNVYKVFQNTQLVPTVDILNKLFTLSRTELRKNFELVWMRVHGKRLPEWEKRYQDLMDSNNIWKHKTLTENTDDRDYYLEPNPDESPDMAAYEGIHILFEKLDSNFSIMNKVHIPVHEPKTPPNIAFNNNNILTNEITNNILAYTSQLYNSDPANPNVRIVRKILDNVRQKLTIRLSDIVMLGYCLQINNLDIFDPACRPVYSIGTLRPDKTGKYRIIPESTEKAILNDTFGKRTTIQCNAPYSITTMDPKYDEMPDPFPNSWKKNVTSCTISGGKRSRKCGRSIRRNGTGRGRVLMSNKKSRKSRKSKNLR
jgi:hypothetical protein